VGAVRRTHGVDTLAALLEREPPPLRKLANCAWANGDRHSAAEKNPSERYASAADLLAALDAVDARNRPLAVTADRSPQPLCGRIVAVAGTVVAKNPRQSRHKPHDGAGASGAGRSGYGAISADGNRVAYVADAVARGACGAVRLTIFKSCHRRRLAFPGIAPMLVFTRMDRVFIRWRPFQQRGVWKKRPGSGKRERIIPTPATTWLSIL
jgi:hypothetical protein